MRFNFWVIFFFPMTGDSYWVFDAERKITGPDSVRQLGLPVSDIHAALKWEDNRIEKVYLFKSYSYWPFSLQENRVEDVHPRSMHKWEGVPSHIDAAFRDRYGKDWELGKATCWLSYLCSLPLAQWLGNVHTDWLTVAFSCPPTGYANFLSGLHYWKLDPVELKVLEGYPRSIGMDFFGCHSV